MILSRFISFLETVSKNEIEYKTNEALSKYSTFKIGGNADLVILPRSVEALISVLRKADEYGVRYTVIGKGSNILFDDDGFRGAVICTEKLSDIRFDGEFVRAQAGASFTHLALSAQKHSLSGLEFAYGIPGTVGGAVYMNAGAYDGETSTVTVESRYYDIDQKCIGTFDRADHNFSYRHSVYMEKNCVILDVLFKLYKGDPLQIKAKMDSFMASRKEKQPLEYPSAGSVFKRYPGYFTAKLIDDAGLKGYSIGGAQISPKHAGFIVNTGNARSRDVLDLIELIQKRIFKLNGINIETEIRYIK